MPDDLNYFNRLVRTRMPGGVGGARSDLTAPYPDQKDAMRAPTEWARDLSWICDTLTAVAETHVIGAVNPDGLVKKTATA